MSNPEIKVGDLIYITGGELYGAKIEYRMPYRVVSLSFDDLRIKEVINPRPGYLSLSTYKTEYRLANDEWCWWA